MTTTAKKAAIYVRVSTAAKVKGAEAVFERTPTSRSNLFVNLLNSAGGMSSTSIPTGQAAPKRTDEA
jgi:hypothetical protein